MVISQGHISFPPSCGKIQTKGILVFETHDLFYIWGLGEEDKVIIFLSEILLIAFSKHSIKHQSSPQNVLILNGADTMIFFYHGIAWEWAFPVDLSTLQC